MNVFPEHELRELSTKLASMFPWKATSLDVKAEEYQESWAFLCKLLNTVEDYWITGTHLAKACDTLCGFLELCIAASSWELRAMCRYYPVLSQILMFYLRRAGEEKSKPMRRVLKTLLRLTTDDSEVVNGNKKEYDNISDFRETAVLQSLKVIFPKQKNSSHAKAAMMLLEALLKNYVIEVSHILYRIYCPTVGATYKATIRELKFWTKLEYVESVTSETLHINFEILVAQVLYWIEFADAAPAASHFLTSLFEALENGDHIRHELAQPPSPLPFWATPLRKILLEKSGVMDAIFHHVLPPLLRLNVTETELFFSSLPYEELIGRNYKSIEEVDIRLCLSVLKIVEELAVPGVLNYTTDSGELTDYSSYVGLVCTGLLTHGSSDVRVAAISTLLHSSSSTTPFTASTLSALRQNIPLFCAEHDPKIRGEYISLMKQFCSRLQSALAKIMRNQALPNETLVSATTEKATENESSEEGCSEILADHLSFIDWYLNYIGTELGATKSYQQHITALKVLQQVKQFGLDHYINAKSIAPTIQRLLLDLTMDPFDDVRNTAATILKGRMPSASVCTTNGSSTQHGDSPKEADFLDETRLDTKTLDQAIINAQSLVNRTGRADYADGFARLCELKCDYLIREASPSEVGDRLAGTVTKHLKALESCIEGLEGSVYNSSTGLPLHGLLIALRYIISRPDYANLYASHGGTTWSAWRLIHEQLVGYCERVWIIVKEVLCIDSPEGHVSEDPEDEETEADSKDLLSFSWRSLKEASSLMLAMITNPGYSPREASGRLSYADLKKLGDLAFTQLAELRHRGAFSTVSQTFLACCVCCAKSNDYMIASLPKHWYSETLLCFEERASTVTRRSAGLPAMITGILAGYSKGPELKGFIFDLQKIASAPLRRNLDKKILRLPQVHALNCLKDVFTTSQLGSATEPYIGTALKIAMDCIINEVWAIRNCGLMLLKALFTRLAGGDSSASNRVESEKFDDLRTFAIEVFTKMSRGGTGQKASFHIILPAIELIERLQPKGRIEEFDFRNWLFPLLSDESWILREKAARAMVPLEYVSIVDFLKYVQIRNDSKRLSTNTLHGRLLCLNYMVEKYNYNAGTSEKIYIWLRSEFDVFVAHQCPAIVATYFSILCHTLNLLRRRKSTWHLISEHRSWWLAVLKAKWVSTLHTRGHSSCRKPASDLLLRELVSIDVLFREMGNSNPPVTEDICAGNSTFVLDLLERKDFSCLACVLEGLESTSGKTHLLLRLDVAVYLLLLESSCDHAAKTLAVSHIMDLIEKQGFEDKWYRIAKIEDDQPLYPFVDKLLNSEHFGKRGTVPPATFVNATLELRGMVLEHDYFKHESLDLAFKGWISAVRLATSENSELTARQTALRSLDRFLTALRRPNSVTSKSMAVMGAFLAFYDLLNDDDEEIRRDAAHSVSWVLSDPSSYSKPQDEGKISLMPLASASELLSFLRSSYRDSPDLCSEAILRLTGPSSEYGSRIVAGVPTSTKEKSSNGMGLTSFKVLFGQARKEDNVLFVEERQNLFIDDVREAERWAEVLQDLSYAAVEGFVSYLETWVLEGLAVLLDAANEEDGPLGWTSKPDVFAMGLRVIVAAEVLLKWIMKGHSKVETEMVRHYLKELAEIGRRTKLHGLWIQRAELSM